MRSAKLRRSAIRGGNPDRRTTRRASRRATRLALLILLLAAPAALWGQTPTPLGWIVLLEPAEWRASRVLTATEGSTVRVLGQAFHNRGIDRITVAGQDANIRPGIDGVVEFEALVPVTNTSGLVVVAITPTSGQPVARDFTLRSLPLPVVAPVPIRTYSPGGAAVGSLLIPGLGQVYTRRPALGLLFLGASAGAAAFGLLSTETTVRCLAPLSGGTCPAGQEHSRSEDTPYLIPGLGAAAGFAVVAAIDAYRAARRLNAQGAVRTGASPSGGVQARPTFGVSFHGVELGLRLAR